MVPGGTGAAAPAIPGKMVSKLKLIYDEPPGWAGRKCLSHQIVLRELKVGS